MNLIQNIEVFEQRELEKTLFQDHSNLKRQSTYNVFITNQIKILVSFGYINKRCKVLISVVPPV